MDQSTFGLPEGNPSEKQLLGRRLTAIIRDVKMLSNNDDWVFASGNPVIINGLSPGSGSRLGAGGSQQSRSKR